jgi:putative intracellular protease/amidase
MMMKSIVRLAIALLLCVPITAASVSSAEAPPARPTVAILLFDGVEIIDYSGPYEVFGAAGYDVYTVGRSKAPVTTAMGLTVVPKYDFSDAPHADILVVPGGRITQPRGDSQTLDWIRQMTAAVKHTLSVCNGAIILADAGLLDGLSATTTDGWIPRMRKAYPKIHVVDDQRFVDNGKIITTAGLSAGIDGALHVVEISNGRSEAQQVALGLEYNWQPDHPFARASLADKQFPDFDLKPVGDWAVSDTAGDRTHWRIAFDGGKGRNAAQVMSYVADRLQADGNWKRVSAGGGGNLRSSWTFTGHDGQPWDGDVTIEPLKSDSGDYRIIFAIARKSENALRRRGG